MSMGALTAEKAHKKGISVNFNLPLQRLNFSEN